MFSQGAQALSNKAPDPHAPPVLFEPCQRKYLSVTLYTHLWLQILTSSAFSRSWKPFGILIYYKTSRYVLQ